MKGKSTLAIEIVKMNVHDVVANMSPSKEAHADIDH